MKRTKVKVRSYAISHGRRSLQLDYYPSIREPESMKMIRFERLGMYIYERPKTCIERRHNEETMKQAEAICAVRTQALVNEEFGFLDRTKPQADFLAFFRKYAEKNNKNWLVAYKHFETFVQGHCTFGQLTINMCLKYFNYIQQAPKYRNENEVLHINSAALYFRIFKYVVFFAYREKWIRENIGENLQYIDTKPTHKEFLVPAELLSLSKAPCDSPILKRASLFSCLTALRYSDVAALEWKNIVPNLTGNGYSVRIRTEKTEAEATIPLSSTALMLCGSRREGAVFEGLNRNMLAGPLKRWLAAAGITKNITFHSFRHTYAILQLASGTDIYTVSRIMTHKHVATTEVYLDLLEETKIGTIDKIQIEITPDIAA